VLHGDPNALQNAIDAASTGNTICFTPSPTFATDGFDYKVRGFVDSKDLIFSGDLTAGRRIVIRRIDNPTASDGGILHVFNGAATIENLEFFGGTAERGGAVKFTAPDDVSITNCLFQDGVADITGGAISFEATGFIPKTLSISQCEFIENFAHFGGAIHVSGNEVTTLEINGSITNPTIFVENSATIPFQGAADDFARGGAIRTLDANLHINGESDGNGNFGVQMLSSSVSDNLGSFGVGGAISFCAEDDASFTMDGVIIDDASADFRGGGIHIQGGQFVFKNRTFNMTNSEIRGGTAIDGGGIFIDDHQLVYTIADSVTIDGNSASGQGGGIAVHDTDTGTIEADITSNSANEGGGLFFTDDADFLTIRGTIFNNTAVDGGGIHCTGFATLDSLLLAGNSATNSGGGAFLSAGSFNSSQNVTVSNNSSVVEGGGIYADNGSTVELFGKSRVSSNMSGDGGGIAVFDGQFFFGGSPSGSSISNNTATGDGGGILAIRSTISLEGLGTSITSNNAANGGGLFADDSFVSQTSSTGWFANSASNQGGGVFAENSNTTFFGATQFIFNSANEGGAIFVEGDNAVTSSMVNASPSMSIVANFAPSGAGILDSRGLNLESFVFSVSNNNSDDIIRDYNLDRAIAIVDDRGFQATNGTMVDLGKWITGSSETPHRFRIFNDSTVDELTVFDVRITGSSDFQIDTSQTNVGTDNLDVGMSTEFSISFSPSSAGAKSATVTVFNDDPNHAVFEIPITAEGVPALEMAQDAYLKSEASDSRDVFGKVVAVSGKTMVVGVYQEDSSVPGINGTATDNGLSNTGACFVFEFDPATEEWVQQAYLKAATLGRYDKFGTSVAISGDTIVVGAPLEDGNATGVNGDEANNSASSAGAAYVFVREPFSQTWSQEAYLKASNTGGGDQFGGSVSVSGNTIVVGAVGEDSNATGVNGSQPNNSSSASGAAYVFERDPTNQTWSQQAYLKASNTAASDLFGKAVAVSGDVVVVGATGEDSNATGINGDGSNNSYSRSGAAYVFSRTGTVWSQDSYLKASNTGISDEFGISVAASGDTVVVGAMSEDSSATGINGSGTSNNMGNSGAAYVFLRTGSAWSQQAYVKSSNPGAFDRFGYSVSISDDAMLIGAKYEASNATGIDGNQADNSLVNTGAAYLFVRTGAAWSQHAYIKPSNSNASDFFGSAVGISGDVAVVGATGEDSGADGVNGNQADNSRTYAGAAYVFDLFGQ